MAAAAKQTRAKAKTTNQLLDARIALVERVEESIYLMRGQRVMLSNDLAELYGVEHRALIQAVKRNPERFPADFLFSLENQELAILKSQSVISSSGWGGARGAPMAFTELGVAMLSSVLRSERAVQANIEIMRAFVRLRSMLNEHKDLKRQLAALERKYDDQFKVVFTAIRDLMTPSDGAKKRRIGFIQD
jgi:ORF6N domain